MDAYAGRQQGGVNHILLLKIVFPFEKNAFKLALLYNESFEKQFLTDQRYHVINTCDLTPW